jgi:hypothetical protein
MQRRILASSAIFLLAGAVVIWLWWPQAEVTLSCCWRGGAILAAAWLAYEDVQRLPGWLLLVLPVLLIALVRWPKLLLLLIPALILWATVRRLLGPGAEHGRKGP